MQVVDQDHHGPPQREVRCEPVEAVQHRERDVAVLVVDDRELPAGEERLGQSGGTAEQLRALFGRRRGEQRLEQLPDDAPESEPFVSVPVFVNGPTLESPFPFAIVIRPLLQLIPQEATKV